MIKNINLGNYKIKKNQLVLTVILAAGLLAGVILVNNPQILKSRANLQILNSFNASGPVGTNVLRTGDSSFDTDTLNVTVTFQDPGAVAGDNSTLPPTVDTTPVDLCVTDEDYAGGFQGCDPAGCGLEVWQCTSDPTRAPETFENPDTTTDCWKNEFNPACPL